MKATLTAIVLAAGALTGAGSAFTTPAMAQDAAMTMDVALSMLELSAQRKLRQYGYGDTDVMGLTLTQLASIRAVTSNGDYNEGERKQQIGVILKQ